YRLAREHAARPAGTDHRPADERGDCGLVHRRLIPDGPGATPRPFPALTEIACRMRPRRAKRVLPDDNPLRPRARGSHLWKTRRAVAAGHAIGPVVTSRSGHAGHRVLSDDPDRVDEFAQLCPVPPEEL